MFSVCLCIAIPVLLVNTTTVTVLSVTDLERLKLDLGKWPQ